METLRRIKDAYPMPRINYILDQLRKTRYISSLALKDGYWQVPLKAGVHGVYSVRNRFIPMESNAIRTSFGVCDLLTGAGPFNGCCTG